MVEVSIRLFLLPSLPFHILKLKPHFSNRNRKLILESTSLSSPPLEWPPREAWVSMRSQTISESMLNGCSSEKVRGLNKYPPSKTTPPSLNYSPKLKSEPRGKLPFRPRTWPPLTEAWSSALVPVSLRESRSRQRQAQRHRLCRELKVCIQLDSKTHTHTHTPYSHPTACTHPSQPAGSGLTLGRHKPKAYALLPARWSRKTQLSQAKPWRSLPPPFLNC